MDRIKNIDGSVTEESNFEWLIIIMGGAIIVAVLAEHYL